jgi:hypothetical protein
VTPVVPSGSCSVFAIPLVRSDPPPCVQRYVQVDEYTSLVSDFGDKADFVAIYVAEAHPADGWNFKIGPQCATYCDGRYMCRMIVTWFLLLFS